LSEKEHQFERIYKETENFGRTQFVREIQLQINDNKKKDKEIERLNNIINKALEKSKGLQYRFGYVLDDLIYLLMQGSDKE